MPLPTTRVVHPSWAAHHAPVAQGAMGATCEITNGSTGGGWDPVNGATPSTPIVTYTGPCRVQYEPTAPRDADAADQAVIVRTVLVALPRAADRQQPGARVRITAVDANGHAALVGRTFTVEAANTSSLSWEQDLTCTEDATNQQTA